MDADLDALSMRGCIRYRQSLDEQDSSAPRVGTEFRHDGDA
jgi:hypothetical protein